MSFVNTTGYSWTNGETVTATKLNLAAVPTIADGQTYTFAAGAAATPSINFTGGTTTGFYLGSSAIGFSVGAASVGTWSTTVLSVTGAVKSTGTGTSAGLQAVNTTAVTGVQWNFLSVDNGDALIQQNGVVNALRLTTTTGAATFASSITTSAPTSGTAGAWKLGIRVAATVALDTTQYIQLDVGGTLYKIGVVA